jgi:hypothetical protein
MIWRFSSLVFLPHLEEQSLDGVCIRPNVEQGRLGPGLPYLGPGSFQAEKTESQETTDLSRLCVRSTLAGCLSIKTMFPEKKKFLTQCTVHLLEVKSIRNYVEL